MLVNKYVVIDYVGNDCYSYSNEIDMGFSVDRILDNYCRYDLPIITQRYNFGKIVVIKFKKEEGRKYV